MKVGILGTGVVGDTLGTKIASLGHEVKMGSRTATNEKAAAAADLVVNASNGAGSLAMLESAGEQNLAGKVLIDVANPLDFSRGRPPTLSICNTDSLGEQIQRHFLHPRVVKALNTMNCEVMVEPGKVPGEHDVFLCGEDADAKRRVTELLESFGWPAGRIVDLGGVESARGTEMYVAFWLRLWGALGTGYFNIAVARGEG